MASGSATRSRGAARLRRVACCVCSSARVAAFLTGHALRAMAKRACDGALVTTPGGDDKRARTDAAGALVPAAPGGGTLAVAGPARTSDLLAPIMLLTGHAAPVMSTKFSPDGQHVLSGSHDKLMLLWETFGECANILTFRGHSKAILEVHWSGDGESAFTASADKTAALWDAKTGARIRQFKGHTSHVNSFCPARDSATCASASDDSACRIWDARVRLCQQTIPHPWAVTAACVAASGTHVYTGCLDGVVRAYDLRRPEKVHLELEGHQDIVTGLALSPDGTSLLSNAMDNVIRCWDVKPYAADDRCSKVFLGAQHNYEKNLIKCAWSANGKQIGAGSADAFVYVWDAASKRIAYKLPGHAGSVNEVVFHPTQPIICSCGNDKNIYLGEIRPS